MRLLLGGSAVFAARKAEQLTSQPQPGIVGGAPEPSVPVFAWQRCEPSAEGRVIFGDSRARTRGRRKEIDVDAQEFDQRLLCCGQTLQVRRALAALRDPL